MAFLSQFFGGIDTLSYFIESLNMMGLFYLNYHIHKTDDLQNKHFSSGYLRGYLRDHLDRLDKFLRFFCKTAECAYMLV